MKRRIAVAGAALALAAPAVAAPPHPEGRAYLVQNGVTGEVLLHYDDRERLPIASITKLMTVLVTLDHAKLGDVVTVAPQAASVGESTINLRAGERITVHDLIEGALIQSANDAAFALAEYVGHGSESAFVELMNEKAKALRLTETHFANPDGLDQYGHYSSAHDVSRLARIAMKNPFIRQVVAQTTATISGGRTLHTWNDLLSTFPDLIGVKTGHTSGAGWSEVAAARGRGVTIYATLLGEPSRAQRNSDLTALLAWGLSRYRVAPVIGSRWVYATAKTGYGKPAVNLVVRRRIYRVIRVDRPLQERVVAPAVVRLPVVRGQRLGRVDVFAGPKLLASEPLVAASSIGKPGFFGRVRWYAKRVVHHVWSWF